MILVPVLGGLIFCQRTTSSRVLKDQNKRRGQFWVFWKISESMNHWFCVFYNPQRCTGSFWSICPNAGLEPGSGFWNFWARLVICICTWCDVWWGFGSESKGHFRQGSKEQDSMKSSILIGEEL
jgi:hypothetical protein